jgi:hypothetical protein
VLSHARALLISAPEGVTDHVEADLREPDKILAEAARTLEFGQPVAILLIGILHLIADEDDPYELVRRLVDAVRPGSYVVISHAASDLDGGGDAQHGQLPERADGAAERPAESLAGGRLLCRARPARTRPGPGAAVAARP